MVLKGADIIMECLLEQGVDTVFGYPGGAVLNIYDALYLYSDKIQHIRTAHEQGAAHAADGYARATGKVGVCIATSGPGATNLVTGIATAYMDSIPMVAITGNVNRDLLGKQSFQEVDIKDIVAPVTKKSFIVMDVEDLAPTIREAFRLANSGRKGPVLIDIPKDITAASCEYEPAQPQVEEFHDQVNESELKNVALKIMEAKRPMIYCGGGVVASDAYEEVKALAEILDAPVSCSLMCMGGYDQLDPRYIGMTGMHGTKTASYAVTNCDLLLAIGTRFSDRVTCDTATFATDCTIVQIDIDTKEQDKNIRVNYFLNGTVKGVVGKLLPYLKKQDHAPWMEIMYEMMKEYPVSQKIEQECGMVTPMAIMGELQRQTDCNCIITTEVGQHQMWAAQFFRYRYPRHFLTSGGLGTMGYGLGAAIGAQVGCPDVPVINIAGDGSFYMNCNELSTLAHYNIPVIEIVFNNQVLGMVRQWQKLFYGRRFSHTDIQQTTDFEKLGAAYGIKALTIKEVSDIVPVLKEALAYKGPTLINCLIDKDLNVLPMVKAGAPVSDPMMTMD